MKYSLLILILLLSSILRLSAQVHINNPATIGQSSRNQKTGISCEVGDTLVVNGRVILNALRGFGTGIVGIDNTGKLSWIPSINIANYYTIAQTDSAIAANAGAQLWKESLDTLVNLSPNDSNISLRTPTNNFNIQTLGSGGMVFRYPIAADTWIGNGTSITAKGALFFGTSHINSQGNYQPVEFNGSMNIEGNLQIQGTTFDTTIYPCISFNSRIGRIYCGNDSTSSYQLQLMNNASVKDSLGIGITTPKAQFEDVGNAIIDSNLTVNDSLKIGTASNLEEGLGNTLLINNPNIIYVNSPITKINGEMTLSNATSSIFNSVLMNIGGDGITSFIPSTFTGTDTMETTSDVNAKIAANKFDSTQCYNSGHFHTIVACSPLNIIADSLITNKVSISSLRVSGISTPLNKLAVYDTNGNVSGIATSALTGITPQQVNPYKTYQAVITQTGTSAPSTSVTYNELGTTMTWGRTSAGLYTLTAGTLVFTSNKTVIILSNPITSLVSYTIIPTSGTVITMSSLLSSVVATVLTATTTDALITNLLVEVRVYN